MNRACHAALMGGLVLTFAFALDGKPAAAAANPQVQAELTRLIAGYAASGQEQFDKLTEAQQQQLASCAAELLGELPAVDMTVLSTGQDLEKVMDVLGERFEGRAGKEAGQQLEACFQTASEQAEAAQAPSTDGETAETAPAGDINTQFLATFEALLRDSNPPAEAAVGEMVTCMGGTLAPVMTDAEKRQSIDTSFSEELGAQLKAAHPTEFEQFMTCGDAVAAKYQ
jgi:hypothetical protein